MFISAVLFLLPFLAGSSLYSVGGDDTRLYYIFPRQMLGNYVLNIVSNNTLGTNAGYGSVSFFIPILLFIIFIKAVLPAINTQQFMYGANLAGGFFFFYLFTGLYAGEHKNIRTYCARIVSSLFYVFSLFVAKTVFSAQLLAVYSLSVFPLVFYLFVRAVRENRTFLTVLAAVCYSAFSSTLLTLPWMAAMAFASLPMVIVLAKNSVKSFIKMTVLFIVLVAGLNFYWVFHQVYPVVVKSGGSSVIGSVSSSAIRQNNIDLIQSLSHLNGPVNQMTAYLRSTWMERNNMGFLQSYGIIYMVCVLLAGLYVSRGEKKYAGAYILAVAGLLFSFILVTPDFGDWNVSMFTFLNNHVPLFAMFRNMYDKFGIAVSFQFAFAICISLTIIAKSIKGKYIFGGIIAIVLAVTMWNAKNFIVPQAGQIKDFTSISGRFNEDFTHLVTYVASMRESSKFAWLPLNFASYVVIEDKEHPGHYYYGASPMQFLAGVSDLTGFQSFATAADPDLNFRMLGYLHNREYEKIGQIFQRMNVKYIIVSRYSIPTDAYAHLNFEGAIDDQKPEFLSLILGNKIQDFGTRYSLYSISNRFENEKLFLAPDFDLFPPYFQKVAFTKTFPYQYDLFVPASREAIHLAFLEPFDRSWSLSRIDDRGNAHEIPQAAHEAVYRYGNGWTVPANILTPDATGGRVHLRIYFRPQKYVRLANGISIVFWIGAAGFLVMSMAGRLLKTHRRKSL